MQEAFSGNSYVSDMLISRAINEPVFQIITMLSRSFMQDTQKLKKQIENVKVNANEVAGIINNLGDL